MTYANKILELNRKFLDTIYEPLVNEAMVAFVKGDNKRIDEVIKQLPNEIMLLEKLIEKLKGKSVYSNICKVLKNENLDILEQKIALNSLLTHIYIEERKNKEYKILEVMVKDKLNKLK